MSKWSAVTRTVDGLEDAFGDGILVLVGGKEPRKSR